MADDTFENLGVWREAVELAARVYGLFAPRRDFGFRDQIQRASALISSNIAEEYERDSNTQFIGFPFIPEGYGGEVRSQADGLPQRFKLLPDAGASALITDAKRPMKRLMRLIDAGRENFA